MAPMRTKDGDSITFTWEGWIGITAIAITLLGAALWTERRLSRVETKVEVLMGERGHGSVVRSDK